MHRALIIDMVKDMKKPAGYIKVDLPMGAYVEDLFVKEARAFRANGLAWQGPGTLECDIQDIAKAIEETGEVIPPKLSWDSRTSKWGPEDDEGQLTLAAIQNLGWSFTPAYVKRGDYEKYRNINIPPQRTSQKGTRINYVFPNGGVTYNNRIANTVTLPGGFIRLQRPELFINNTDYLPDMVEEEEEE